MSLKYHKFFMLALLWAIIILIKICFPNSIGQAKFNGYIVGVMAIICYALRPSVAIGILSLFSFVILYFFSKDLIHPLGDLTLIIMSLCAYDLCVKDHLNGKEYKYIYYITTAFIFLDFVGIGIPSLYSGEGVEGMRYDGILHSGNVTATVFCLCQIMTYEYLKHRKPTKRHLYISLVLFGIMLIVTKTRSMLFFAPYWLCQCYVSFNRKVFFTMLLIAVLFIVKSLSSLQASLRFEEDGSFLTRLTLYQSMIDGIISQPLIPQGSYAANQLSKDLTLNDNYAPHNDILMYIYDWGFIFFIILVYVYFRGRGKFLCNWSNATIVLGWSSGALHNILLLPQILLVFFIIENYRIHSQYEITKH